MRAIAYVPTNQLIDISCDIMDDLTILSTTWGNWIPDQYAALATDEEVWPLAVWEHIYNIIRLPDTLHVVPGS